MTKCIEHKLHVMNTGYGQLTRDGKKWLAHRWAWTEANGEIPEGLHVLHKCDNRLCIRIDHLFLGTNRENVDDKMQKGRQLRGSAHGKSKLDEAAVAEIRYSGLPARELADRYGVHRNHIYNVRSDLTRWAHV